MFEKVRAEVAATQDEPAFYYVHLMDPHHPYRPPKRDLRRVRSAVLGVPKILPNANLATAEGAPVRDQYARYLAEVRDFDAQVGAFLDFLKQLGLYENALIFITSDHGEEFLDHGGVYHGRNLYEESLAVPGLLKLPGNEKGGTRIDRPANLADLLPTLSARLGLKPPPGVDGSDLLAPESPELPQVATLVLDGQRMAAISDRGWKLILDYGDGGMELFDLAADPGETHDLARERADKVHELRTLLDRMGRFSEPGWHLRGCGCDHAATVAFGVRAPGAEIGFIDLEEGDSVALADDGTGFDVVFHLPPILNRQVRFGQTIAIPIRDRDEISLGLVPAEKDVASADWILLAPPGDSNDLRVAFGNEPPGAFDAPVSLASRYETATLGGREPASCDPTPAEPDEPVPYPRTACEAHLRVWYVKPLESVSESSVDWELRERLKALGYTW